MLPATLATVVEYSGARTAEIWVYIVLGVVTLVGGGGLVALVKWLRSSAVRDSRLDALIDPKFGVNAQLREIRHTIRPNGGTSNQLGDVVARIEKAVNALRDDFHQHKGESDAIHRQLRTDIDRKQDKAAQL